MRPVGYLAEGMSSLDTGSPGIIREKLVGCGTTSASIATVNAFLTGWRYQTIMK